jgi:hypothetical protein
MYEIDVLVKRKNIHGIYLSILYTFAWRAVNYNIEPCRILKGQNHSLRIQTSIKKRVMA